jgi:hypothetical protein
MKAQIEQFSTSKLPGGSTTMDRVFAAIVKGVKSLGNVVNNDTLITVTVAGAGNFQLNHGLGQPVTTWEVVRRNSSAVVYEATPSVNTDVYLNMVSSAAGTLTFRVS